MNRCPECNSKNIRVDDDDTCAECLDCGTYEPVDNFTPVDYDQISDEIEGSFVDRYYQSVSPECGIKFWCETYEKEWMCITNVPHYCIQHSPDGFSWGYGGSGPADFALNILETILRATRFQGGRMSTYSGSCFRLAWKFHQQFKREFLVGIDRNGSGYLAFEDIHGWLVEQVGEKGLI